MDDRKDVSSASVEIVQSWGVASARSTSGFPASPSAASATQEVEHVYDVPIGPSVVRWDLTSQKRLMQFQAHSDLVTCARKSPDQTLIASSSYSGGVKLWSSDWECLACTVAPMESQFHLSWSLDSRMFLVLGNGKESSIVMYTVGTGEASGFTLSRAWVLPAKGCPTPSNAEDDNSQLKPDFPTASVNEARSEPGKNYPYEKAFFMAEFNPSGNIFAVEEIPYTSTLVHLVSPSGVVVKTVDLVAMIGDLESWRRPVNTVFISAHHEGVYAVGLEGGRVVLVDAELLEPKKTFKVGGGFRAAVWDKNALVVPSDDGKVAWWDTDSGEKLLEFESCIQDCIVRMDWSASGQGLWMCGFSCLAYLVVDRDQSGVVKAVTPSFAVHCHELTSVGVGFDPGGKMVGSGDMAGNVWVTEKDTVTPLHKFSVSGSVRCLTWVNEESLLVGSLDGGIHWWGRGDSQPHLLLQRQGSIICMQFDGQRKLLAVGTSKGMLCVYDIESGRDGTQYNTVVEMIAHPPQLGPQDQRFGQLGEQAEIWSLCWSPDEAKLATCSEDQTLKVWSSDDWKCLATLRGHTLAVTSVDWVQHGTWNLLASCSDDKTIRLASGESYELLCIVNTKDIYGWHTLTYLAFYPHKDCPLLLCTTQNGHLVAWRLQETNASRQESSQQQPLHKEDMERAPMLCRVWKGKVHLGSVEGLAWQNVQDGGTVATVGADCNVHLFKVVLLDPSTTL